MIPFSPPDITQDEIDEVVDTLKSGWITTGPKTKQLENELATFVGVPKVACLGSATAALECALRLLGVGPGDEVITVACGFPTTINPGSYEMDYGKLPKLVTERTKAVIPVDIAGRMVDYDSLEAALQDVKPRWRPSNAVQALFPRLPIVADAAHSLGARRHGLNSGQAADLTAFSFHAVKNFTTAEGGALTWRSGLLDDDEAYKDLMLMSLHGQTKDALAKDRAGAWEYDIAFPGWKCNMTDIQAALGLAQLRRYPDLLARRRDIVALYEKGLADAGVTVLRHVEGNSDEGGFSSSCHLMLVRLDGRSREFRDELIARLAEAGVSSNVHYKPLPLLTAYRDLGFDIVDFPNALAQFENEITLPLHTRLSDADVDTVICTFKRCKRQMEDEGLR